MSEDHNQSDVALNEDNNEAAVQDQTVAPEEDKLWAGKFKSPEAMEKGYQDLQIEYSRSRQAQPQPQAGTTDDGSIEEVAPILDAWAKQYGLVTKAELERERKEEDEFKRFFASNPYAAENAEKIKLLAKSDAFRGKSLEEISQFLGTPSGGAKGGKPVKMGSNTIEDPDEVDTKSRDFWLKK